GVDHGIHRTGTAQGPAAGPEETPVARAWFWFGVVAPVVTPAVHQHQHVQWIAVANPVGAIAGACCDQADPVARICRQPVRQYAARRAGAHDDVVKFGCHAASLPARIMARFSFSAPVSATVANWVMNAAPTAAPCV